MRDRQSERLQKTIVWARRIRSELQPALDAHGDRVHFRPSSTGVAMVGLLPDRPQRGRSGITNLKEVAAAFEAEFDAHCRNVEHRRVTGEKRLQSFLIGEAQTNGRRLMSLNRASAATDAPVELLFITDEIALPVEAGKVTVCDILALRRDGGRCTPVVIELKDSRQLKRLVEQVEGYARLVDDHADLFAGLYGALLGEELRFDAPTEKWLVWPAHGPGPDPRTRELREGGIRLVAYDTEGAGYRFVVGPGVETPPRTSHAVVKTSSLEDPRLTGLVRLGTGEGFATYVGEFEGKPALITDCGTLADILDEDDSASVTVRVFEGVEARDLYLNDLRRRSPAALGSPVTTWET